MPKSRQSWSGSIPASSIGTWGAADEAVLNNVDKKKKNKKVPR